MNATPLPNLTASQQRTYDLAVKLWRAAGLHIRNSKFIRPTLGAQVERSRFRLVGRAV